MKQNMLPFFNVLSGYSPPVHIRERLEGALIAKMTVEKEKRSITIILHLPFFADDALLGEISCGIAAQYDVTDVSILPKYGAELLGDEAYRHITEVISREYPAARGLLSDAEWEETGDGLLIRTAGDAGLHSKVEPLIKEYISRHFEPAFTVTLLADELDRDELFERTESIRNEALRDMPAETPNADKKAAKRAGGKTVLMGRAKNASVTPMKDLHIDMGAVTVCGDVFYIGHRELKNRGAFIICFDMTDYTGSVRVSKFMEAAEAKKLVSEVKEGLRLTVSGRMNYSKFENDMVLEPQDVCIAEKQERMDNAEVKRVELHMHTNMSAMDALTDVGRLVKTASAWGHKAVAVTDHGVTQAFPDAFKAGKKHGVKILYGIEAYFSNDTDIKGAVCGDSDVPLDSEFIAFDLETTGLNSMSDQIIEIGAVLIRGGEIIDTFHSYVKADAPLPEKIKSITGITDKNLKDAPELSEALPEFLDFAGQRLLCAHNADFDMAFVSEACTKLGYEFNNTSVDTLAMARALLPEHEKFSLQSVAYALRLPKFKYHSASDDAMAVALIIKRFFAELKSAGLQKTGEINAFLRKKRENREPGRNSRHMIILAKNRAGLKNMYKLISLAHIKYFKRNPIIPKSELDGLRGGLIIGSACENGELFAAVVKNKRWDELKRIASYYDFLEIQPICNNMFMLRAGTAADAEQLREFNRKVVKLGEELNIPVVATGDVHFLNPEDEVYRHILLAGRKFPNADDELPIYFKTTDEMLDEFSYLGTEKAYEVVVTNTNLVADMCEDMSPLPKGLSSPKIEGSAEELTRLVMDKMTRLYGENPPELVKKRVDTELGDIISCGYDVIYIIAQKLVKKSLEAGYLVGSRGSVGSSIVAYMSGITEVNALPPHYRCPVCKHSDFEPGSGYGCGADMPDAMCPECGANYEKDGFDIPFETFLGFGGNKIPDIDLNFSGEYQAEAHRQTIELFGKEHVFRAGTIGTIKEKTAYGFVKKYLEERGINCTKAEENRLTVGCVGVKRTTGQHPGGLVVVPSDKEIYEFCPVQRPADDTETDIITTHFEYHAMEDNLLKLDLLGHDDPTMIRMLEDLTGTNASEIPLDDPGAMSIFTSTERLGIQDDPVLGKTGACAIPEFGTKFVREMLLDIKPSTFDELVKISGFSHGTDVWLNNAKDLITSKTATANEVISARDDIMLRLIALGMDEKLAFYIMEDVRKGKGLKPEWEAEMRKAGVRDWYINSCNLIKYLFPKAHAVAYVIMAFRIAWYKVYYPKEFYSAYFTIRATAFDAAIMTKGMGAVLGKIKEIENNKSATAVERDMLTTLEVCYEFYKRGFVFENIDIYKSDSKRFIITENGLRPPFIAVTGLGESAAGDIVLKREGRVFISEEEIALCCTKLSSTNLEQLRAAGAFGDLPETSQMSLF